MLHEKGKIDLKVGSFRIEPLFHLFENQMKFLQVELAVKPFQDLDETTHMCSLKPVRQVNIHVDRGHGLLEFLFAIKDRNGIGDRLDTDLPDIDTPIVVQVLDIFHWQKPEVRGQKPENKDQNYRDLLCPLISGFWFLFSDQSRYLWTARLSSSMFADLTI